MTKGTHNYLEDNRNKDIKIYVNGKIFSRENASISVFDSGFLLGDGVWEGIRLLNGELVFLNEHLERLFFGAKQLDINIGCSRKDLIKIIHKTLNANKMINDVHIRLIVSRGLKKTPYQHPNANIQGSTIVIIPEYKKADKKINEKGINLVTVNIRRGTSDTQDPRLNTLSKLNCILACIEADKAGADEGIMLDINGNVSTCNSTNFFIIRKGEVWTSKGIYCLPGITRKMVINLCKENNIPTGLGRGSAAGSLVLYLIGVTKVDPLEHGLFFERFISKIRAKKSIVDGVTYLDGSLMMDVDLDICYYTFKRK